MTFAVGGSGSVTDHRRRSSLSRHLRRDGAAAFVMHFTD